MEEATASKIFQDKKIIFSDKKRSWNLTHVFPNRMVMEEEAIALQEPCHALSYHGTLESNAQGFRRPLHLNRHSTLRTFGRQLDRDDLVKIGDARQLQSKKTGTSFRHAFKTENIKFLLTIGSR